jgi:hypothetical protein
MGMEERQKANGSRRKAKSQESGDRRKERRSIGHRA